jgi:hypothetical protein
LRPFNSGKGGGFHESWSSGAPEVAQAVEALKPLQSKAFEIGDSNKEKVACCCCCPPGFTEGAAKNTAAEMIISAGEDQDIATSALEVILFLIPGVANPVAGVEEGADMSR